LSVFLLFVFITETGTVIVCFRWKHSSAEDRVSEQYIHAQGSSTGYWQRSGNSVMYGLYSQLGALVGCGSWFTDGR